ncbi:MAG: type I-F CRISPR-associated endoribonuclease Cas6/Csy4 [Betaproteobacteria bacterium HGW-Betaproteobacteria-13]|jgi:CRISPR-associated endonuclease Csy4|uniref:Type I-F CRISPR-associated endoribonuclease Cas6/Csy4 n=1 Tax=Parazoarcus communis TaxID=41977 RepID=A0A2U8H968_9RHOO|nr:type I-F CRISPR-associated endoribonuclease Cas6/Csy4 [Parazoarcus communis]AWI81285.1 type I-F CRISPR-associated endoribonuclease Cas6/Csy4 [Parazoarcus communis]PKO57161.1 MAG: type I-F CRISPR-associated endoribonuclease Cas6/Csy4 [Betaproteobacteria bacterium HGW-Betaproteobacteria-21]PKO82362.1 MAG: type I-F CRISPR-associated endoribonuclease Cas6/Csy4 [Betaproteobacteria bacterium HGW-Betaproteobacteria-13]
MDHYIDIKLLPDPEFSAPMLMNALFAKLHRGLVDHGGGDIGVSFPEVGGKTLALGSQLRLHGNSTSLGLLMQNGWTQGMRDHITLIEPRPIPTTVQHRVVRRVQAKSNPDRLRRRLMSRKSIGAEEALTAIPDSSAKRLTLPYVEMSSRSTGQRFRLFIEHLAPQPEPVAGGFGTYGLSDIATVPWF